MTTIHQFPDHIMTMAELKEYRALNEKVHAGHSFIEMDWDNPDHVRLNELAGKYQKFRQYILELIGKQHAAELDFIQKQLKSIL